MTKEVTIKFVDMVDIDSIHKRERETSVRRLIKEYVNQIPKGKAVIVQVSSGSWGTFSNAVSSLRRSGMIPNEYCAMRRGKVFYLARK